METEKQQRRRINQVIEKNPRGIIIIIMCVCYYYIEGKLGTEETTNNSTQTHTKWDPFKSALLSA